jgi:hypothetical protein
MGRATWFEGDNLYLLRRDLQISRVLFDDEILIDADIL